MIAELETDASIIAQLAPTGTLRVAVNLDNAVLVQRHPDTQELSGVVVDLAVELAERIKRPVQLLPFESAAKIVDTASAELWDVSFFAIDPARAQKVWYSAPYIVIEGSYMVPIDSDIKHVEHIDRPGIRVAVGVGAAYDLYLTRTLKHATLVRDVDSPAAIERFSRDQLEVVAGVRQPLVAYALLHPQFRVVPGHFTEIQQAMVAPLDRPDVQALIDHFIEDAKASGFVADALKRAGQTGAAVAPLRASS